MKKDLVGSVVLSALVATFAIAPRADASALYAVSFPGATNLYSVDQASGALSSIGATGQDGLGDLTSDTRPGSFRMWGIRIASNELFTIDPATGTASAPVSLNSSDNIVSIAFNPVSGRLYGNTSVGFGAGADQIYEINPLTGTTTLIGSIGFDNVFTLGFSQSGTLYGVSDSTNELIQIDLSTGAGALITSLDLSLVFDMASRPEDDTMFIADSGTSSLYTLDTATGSVALVGGYGSLTNVVGLAFSQVPEPGGAFFLLSAAGIGLAFSRRRR